MVFISKEKLHVSAYSGHLQVLTTFLLKQFHIICSLGILYKTLLVENCQNLKMAAIGRNMQFFLVNKHHHLAIFYSCVFSTEFTSAYSLNAQRGWHTSE